MTKKCRGIILRSVKKLRSHSIVVISMRAAASIIAIILIALGAKRSIPGVLWQT